MLLGVQSEDISMNATQITILMVVLAVLLLSPRITITWKPANARLIAAAPELFDALTQLLNCPDLNLDELEPETQLAVAQARAALAKAENIARDYKGNQ